jgi:tetratricopeptide (TPR) repeat protein
MFMKRALICLWSAVLLSCLASGLICQDAESRIQRLYSEARSKEQSGDLNAAIEKYKAILQLDPKLAAAYNNLGRLYLRQGRYPEAIEALKHALKLDERLAPAHALMGMSWYEMENYGAAEREFEEAVHLDPHDQNAKLYLARSLYELGKLDEAAGLLKELAHGDPANPQILYNQGLVYMKLASSALEKLQAAAPDSFLIESILATTAEAKEQYGVAAEHYKRAIAKAPNTRNLHYALGHALYQSGDFKEALKEYQLELQINPYSYMACWEAARILINDDPTEAVTLSTRALEMSPNLSPAYLVRGRALLQLKDLDKSLKDLKKAAALDPNEPTVHYQLARVYRGLGLKEQAEQENAIFTQMEKAEHSSKGDVSPDEQLMAPQGVQHD